MLFAQRLATFSVTPSIASSAEYKKICEVNTGEGQTRPIRPRPESDMRNYSVRLYMTKSAECSAVCTNAGSVEPAPCASE